MRAMRERLEAVARRKSPRVLAVLLLVLVTTWIASASLLDKRWHEVVLDVLPYLIVEAALLRVQPGMRSIAARMKGFEREVGDDPDSTEEDDGGGPTVIAL